jgi:hypothetical protein
MGLLVPEYEVHSTAITVDPNSGIATITCLTGEGTIALYLAGDVLLLLKDQIEANRHD